MIEARGVEEIHTELIHQQFGLAAVSGGFLSGKDFKWLEVFFIIFLSLLAYGLLVEILTFFSLFCSDNQ